MIVLDTDIISLLDRQSDQPFEALTRRLSASVEDRVCVTIISFEEQMRGWLSYIAASRTSSRQIEGYGRLQKMLAWYQRQEILPFDPAASAIFESLRRSRLKLGTMDLRIAAVVRAHDALLISGNTKGFKLVPGLRVEDWTR
ncbi:MAG TPA: type II toxin-antitoxin system VapC family toxin [Tepidisphaeraceae bacterium]|nr:type II toxin-antitoxin system VapC family toxin [Tepidisphaeraceae bacterium]